MGYFKCLFIYLGGMWNMDEPMPMHILYDTVEDCFEVWDCGSNKEFKEAIDLGIMKALYSTTLIDEYDKQCMFFPYKKKYIALDNFVKKIKKVLVQRKLIGMYTSSLRDIIAELGLSVPEGISVYPSCIVLENTNIVCDFNGDLDFNGLNSALGIYLPIWEFVEILNKYGDKPLERSSYNTTLCKYFGLGQFEDGNRLIYEGSLLREYSLAELIRLIHRKGYTTFNIGFLKEKTEFFDVDNPKSVSVFDMDTCVIQKEGRSWLRLITLGEDLPTDLGSDFTAYKTQDSENIVWLSQDITKKYYILY